MIPTRIEIEGGVAEAARWIPFARKKLALYERQFGPPYQRQLEPEPGVYIRIEHLAEGHRVIYIKAAGGIRGYEFETRRHLMSQLHAYDMLWSADENISTSNPGPIDSWPNWPVEGSLLTPGGGTYPRDPGFKRYTLLNLNRQSASLVITTPTKGVISPIQNPPTRLDHYTGLSSTLGSDSYLTSMFWSADAMTCVASSNGMGRKYANGIWAAFPGASVYESIYSKSNFYYVPTTTSYGIWISYLDTTESTVSLFDYGRVLLRTGKMEVSTSKPNSNNTGQAAKYGQFYVAAILPSSGLSFTVCNKAAFFSGANPQAVDVSIAMPAWYVASFTGLGVYPTKKCAISWQFSPHAPKAIGVVAYWEAYSDTHWKLRQGVVEVAFDMGYDINGILYASASVVTSFEVTTGLLVAADYAWTDADVIRILHNDANTYVAFDPVEEGAPNIDRACDTLDWHELSSGASALGTPYRSIPMLIDYFTNDNVEGDELGYRAELMAVDLLWDSFAMVKHATFSGADGPFPNKISAKKLLVINGATITDESIPITTKLDVNGRGWEASAEAPPTSIPTPDASVSMTCYLDTIGGFQRANSPELSSRMQSLEFLRRSENANAIYQHPAGHWSVICPEIWTWNFLSTTPWTDYQFFDIFVDGYAGGIETRTSVLFDTVAWFNPDTLAYQYTTHRDILLDSRPAAELYSLRIPYAFHAVWMP